MVTITDEQVIRNGYGGRTQYKAKVTWNGLGGLSLQKKEEVKQLFIRYNALPWNKLQIDGFDALMQENDNNENNLNSSFF